MFENMRRRIALLIAPELSGFNPRVSRPAPANDRESRNRALADSVREVAAVFFAAGGTLPLWKADRDWLEGLGYSWSAYNTAKTSITRVTRDEIAGVTARTHHDALRMLSLSWPVGAQWPRHIPRPSKSKEAA